MNWDRSALITVDILGFALVGRLLGLQLQRVYKVFCAYLTFNLLSSSVALIEQVFISVSAATYQLLFLTGAVGTWVFTLWIVYALLEAILAQLPGILKFSRRLLVVVSVVASVVAIVSVRADYSAFEAVLSRRSLDSLVELAIVVERIVTAVSLFSLLAIQAFVLWFPIQMPRNLVFFCMGFVFNFLCETALLLVGATIPDFRAKFLNPLNLFQLGACFAYWAVVITKEGEIAPVTVGHTWDPGKQAQLVNQLASINAALLRTSPGDKP